MDAHEYSNGNTIHINALSLDLDCAQQVKNATETWVLRVGSSSSCLTITASKVCVKKQNNSYCDVVLLGREKKTYFDLTEQSLIFNLAVRIVEMSSVVC